MSWERREFLGRAGARFTRHDQGLKDAGIRLGFLSNLTAGMWEAGIRNSELDGMFEQELNTDRVKVYKPDPRAYQGRRRLSAAELFPLQTENDG